MARPQERTAWNDSAFEDNPYISTRHQKPYAVPFITEIPQPRDHIHGLPDSASRMANPVGTGPPEVTNSTSQGNGDSNRPTAIAWQDPILAFLFFIAGLFTAVGHHIYYGVLDGTPVNSDSQQVWAIRIGTGLAFLTRTCLTATLGIVVVQQFWATLRKRAMTIEAIDSMFGIMTNPWLFLNKDMLMHAKRVCAFAAISWLVHTCLHILRGILFV